MVANLKVVVMGVCGCGKSSVGAALAAALNGTNIDGDDLHPPSNIEKMSAGTPLTDADRWPWLDQVGHTLGQSRGVFIIGCSALKRSYRDRIRDKAQGPVIFAHLTGSKALIASRMQNRPGHFMPTALLDSQFEALEPPAADEDAVAVSIDQPLDRIVKEISAVLLFEGVVDKQA